MKLFSISRLALPLVLSTAIMAPAAVRAQAETSVDTSVYYNASVITAIRKQSIVNPMAQLIAGADTLAVSEEQVDSVSVHNATYLAAAAHEWASFQRFLDAQPKGFKVSDVMPTLESTYANVLAVLAREATATKALLSANQIAQMPADFRSTLAAAVETPAPRK